MSFVHLAVHTEFSLADSIVRVKPLIARAAELQMPAIAVTDLNNLFALVKFFSAAEKAGIKPIAGADLWVDNGEGADRLMLLCQNRAGFNSLSQLISRAFLERPPHGPPNISPDWLKQCNEGLIAVAGGTQGEVGRLILDGKPKRASEALARYCRLFPDRFYIDIARTGRPGENRYLEAALHLAHEHRVPVVAVNDVRFLHSPDFSAHEARVCIHQGRILDDASRPRDHTDQQYLKSPQEMAELFADLPQALDNAVELAQRCNLALDLGTYYLPEYPVPDGSNTAEHLRQLAQEGMAQRLQNFPPPAETFGQQDYQNRLDHELGVIGEMGFPGYFLIVADFIAWAKRQAIPVGPGRGSGAGSLAAYALGITDLDPLVHDLLFERFLNPERVSMPDFDIDFCMDRRDEVIDYVAQRYGRDKVCQIITFGTMAARAVVRDCGRVLGFPYGFVDGIAKLIPGGPGVTLESAMHDSPELAERTAAEEDVGELLKLARSLEGITRNAGKHAGGVVIAPKALTLFAPLYCETAGESVVTQFDKDDVETVGLVKFDFLGLRTLTIIDWAAHSINEKLKSSGMPLLDMNRLPMEDEKTFALLRSCRTTAVFQLESRGMKDLIRRLQPESFDDIVALVALFRPGPLDSGMVDTYIDCKHGRLAVRFPHPELEEILDTTYGVILYQEQVMQIAQVLAGYTLGGADILRRAMGKKKPAEMAKQRVIFVTGASGRGIEPKLAESIFDLMETFAGYGFNKSHSAAYALLSYQTAYLKAHYPSQFMAAVLSADMDNTDKVVGLIDDARHMQLEILNPDVNRSVYPFNAVADDQVLYGLGAIKGVGRGAIEAMVEERSRGGEFGDLLDFCTRIDLQKLNRRALEAMILAGAMDKLGENRASLSAALPEVLRAAEQHNRNRAAGQIDLFGAPAPAPDGPVPCQLPEWDDQRRLEGELKTLGLYLSGHPMDPHRENLDGIVSCALGKLDTRFQLASDNRQGTPATLAGLLLGLRRRGARSAFAQLDDGTGRIELAFFGKALDLNAPLLVANQMVVAEGNLLPDDFTGGVRMRVSQLSTLDHAYARHARALRLTLSGNSFNLEQFRNAIAAYQPGTIPIVVNYENGQATARLKLGDEFRVAPADSLLGTLTGLDGVVGAQLVFPKTRLN